MKIIEILVLQMVIMAGGGPIYDDVSGDQTSNLGIDGDAPVMTKSFGNQAINSLDETIQHDASTPAITVPSEDSDQISKPDNQGAVPAMTEVSVDPVSNSDTSSDEAIILTSSQKATQHSGVPINTQTKNTTTSTNSDFTLSPDENTPANTELSGDSDLHSMTDIFEDPVTNSDTSTDEANKLKSSQTDAETQLSEVSINNQTNNIITSTDPTFTLAHDESSVPSMTEIYEDQVADYDTSTDEAIILSSTQTDAAIQLSEVSINSQTNNIITSTDPTFTLAHDESKPTNTILSWFYDQIYKPNDHRSVPSMTEIYEDQETDSDTSTDEAIKLTSTQEISEDQETDYDTSTDEAIKRTSSLPDAPIQLFKVSIKNRTTNNITSTVPTFTLPPVECPMNTTGCPLDQVLENGYVGMDTKHCYFNPCTTITHGHPEDPGQMSGFNCISADYETRQYKFCCNEPSRATPGLPPCRAAVNSNQNYGFTSEGHYEEIGVPNKRTYFTESAHDCQRKCQLKQSCSQFNFRRESAEEEGECVLIQEKGDFLQDQDCNSCITGPKFSHLQNPAEPVVVDKIKANVWNNRFDGTDDTCLCSTCEARVTGSTRWGESRVSSQQRREYSRAGAMNVNRDMGPNNPIIFADLPPLDFEEYKKVYNELESEDPKDKMLKHMFVMMMSITAKLEVIDNNNKQINSLQERVDALEAKVGDEEAVAVLRGIGISSSSRSSPQTASRMNPPN